MKLSKIGAVLIAGTIALTASGCANPGTAHQADDYCVDQYGNVVDWEYCDAGGGGYLLWHDSGHHKYKPGKRIPSSTFYKGKTSSTKPTSGAVKSNTGTVNKAPAPAPKPAAKPAPKKK